MKSMIVEVDRMGYQVASSRPNEVDDEETRKSRAKRERTRAGVLGNH